MNSTNPHSRQGFALIVTLIMVVLGAVTVIALLSNASLERTTATSYGNRLHAELAVQNGLDAAKKALTPWPSPSPAPPLTGDDTFLVVRVNGPQLAILPSPTPGPTPSYYYIAKARPGAAGGVDYYPLFAGAQPVLGVTPPPSPSPSPNTGVPTPPPNPSPSSTAAAIQTDRARTKITKAYPELSRWLAPAATEWIEVADPADTGGPGSHTLPYQRYTYWIEDLGGYIDGRIAGNIADGGKNKRPLDSSSPAKRYVSTPGEIALFTIFQPSATSDSGTTGAELLINNRILQFTSATAKQIAPAAASPDLISSSIAARLARDSEQALVPFGYGYVDEGDQTKPRVDLNALLTSGGGPSAVDAIALKINQNLPTFGTDRKGGLTGIDYVKTISASIIDYADTDSDATVDAAAGTGYRGLDSYPVVNEIYIMKWWTGTTLPNVDILMETWVELWNPSNQNITGTATFEILENHPVTAGLYTYTFGTTPADTPNGSSVNSQVTDPGSITMEPNEYRTFKVRRDQFRYNTGITPPLTLAGNTLPLAASLKSNYKMSWNNKVVDTAGLSQTAHIQRISGSLPRTSATNYASTNKRFRGSYPGFGYTVDPNSGIPTYNTMGDPRSAYYTGSGSSPSAQAAIAYDVGSSFWVRNNRSNVNANLVFSAQHPAHWPDGGHDTAKITATPSPATGDPPTSRPPGVTTEKTKAPGTISNTGSFATVAELANIYDPGNWNIPFDNSSPPRWSNLTNSDITATSQADSNYGGGMTLRIGRPEFTLFDKPRVRAWQLLDLFTTGPRINTEGLININTASREALRALGANVLLNRDPDLVDGSTPPRPITNLYPPFTSGGTQADQFADAVIAARPFLSPAQLSSLKVPGSSPPQAFFGNMATWSGGSQTQPKEWNDSGTEEYFAKVFPLATVRSRNFRVFVTGQALDKNNNVLSTVSKVFQVHLRPTRDATGKITSQQIVTTYEAQLPL